MGLYINLLHEVQKQKLARQRDPLKLGIMALLVVAVGFVAYYFYRVEAVSSIKNQQTRLQTDWNKIAPSEKMAEAHQAELDQSIKLADFLVHKVENRFYWAPLIEQIVKNMPPEVQLTVLDGAVSAESSKKVKIVLNGTCIGDQPRAVAEELRTALQSKLGQQYQQVTAMFGSLEDGLPIQYKGRTSPSANFQITLNFVCADIDDANKPKAPARIPKP